MERGDTWNWQGNQMAVPGRAWLNDQLNRTDSASGGYQAEMGHPVMGAPGVGDAGCFVVAWLLALVPLLRLGGAAAGLAAGEVNVSGMMRNVS